MTIPAAYKDLLSPDAPRMIREAVALYGTVEEPGARNNPKIMAWAKETAKHVKGYTADSIPWCGLFASVVAERSGFESPENPLWALNWLNFGTVPEKPGLGDILVWRRPGGGHVGFYVGEDSTHYHCLGGNQGDKVSIIRLPKKKVEKGVGFRGARRPKWRVAQPASVRPIIRAASGLATGGTLS